MLLLLCFCSLTTACNAAAQDWLPTLVLGAGGTTEGSLPLDGYNQFPGLVSAAAAGQGKPHATVTPPRAEVFYGSPDEQRQCYGSGVHTASGGGLCLDQNAIREPPKRCPNLASMPATEALCTSSDTVTVVNTVRHSRNSLGPVKGFDTGRVGWVWAVRAGIGDWKLIVGDGGLPNTWFAPVNASAAAHAAEQAQCDEPSDVYLTGPSAESPFRECSNGVGLGCGCCRGSDATVAANSSGCCRAAADA